MTQACFSSWEGAGREGEVENVEGVGRERMAGGTAILRQSVRE